MISWAYILGAQRARTRWPGAPRAGMERRQVGAGPLSSNLLSQVTDPPKIVKADFTMLSENPRAGRESLTNLPPMENFGRPTILLPGHLDYHLSGAYIGISIHLRCLWDFGKRQIRPHTRTPEQSSRRTAKLSKVSCLGNNLLLLGVVHYFKEWVRWLLPEEEERLILSYKYPLQIYAYWKTSDD